MDFRAPTTTTSSFPSCIVALSLIALACALTPPAPAQESTSFRVREHVLNLGGHPERGGGLVSASYRIRMDSLGEGVVRSGLSSASFHMDASFGTAYRPPGEVTGLRFTDDATLAWNPERSAGSYNVYRDALTTLTGGGYGTCWEQEAPGATVTDADPVPAGGGFFYLVTAENRLGEEGTKGRDSDDAERGGDVCP